MNILINIADIKTRMVLIDASAGDPMIQSAVRAAQTRLQAELDTRFDQADNQQDVFYLDSTVCGYITPNKMFRLRLTNGLLRPDPITVELCDNRLFETGTTETLTLTTDYLVDAVRGYVMIDESHEGKYARVTYGSGFAAWSDAVTPKIPDWLYEAIVAYTPVVFNFAQVTNRKDEAEKGYRMSGDHALACLVPYHRKLGFSLSPLT